MIHCKLFIATIITLFLCGEILISDLDAQTRFQVTVGGSNVDEGHSIIQSSDGGYAVAGWASGSNAYDFYILKLNANGALQWTKTVGGNNDDLASCIIQTLDGGYAVVGGKQVYGGYFVKLDASGTLQWARTIAIGGSSSSLTSILQLTSGSYIMAGATGFQSTGNRDVSLTKLDANGNLLWTRTVGGGDYDYGISVIQTREGGYAIAGRTLSFGAGYDDVYILKFDSSGTLQWTRTVGGPNVDRGIDITQGTDGGYAIAGYTYLFGADNDDIYDDVYIVKVDSNGVLQWTKTVGGSNNDEGNSIITARDGGYVVAGLTNSFGAGQYDIYIVKLDANGSLQWTRTIGGSGLEIGESIIQTMDGGYAVTGSTRSSGASPPDVLIVKLDSTGLGCGSTFTGGVVGSGGVSGSGGIVGSGGTIGSDNPLVLSLGTLTTLCYVGMTNIETEFPRLYRLYQNYPNPFNAVTAIRFDITQSAWEGRDLNVKLSIYELSGREIETPLSKELKPGTYEVSFEGSNYASGVYYYRLTAGDFSETKKMILLK